ncbi:MAG TPA: hypothetical protein VJB06_02985, partial [archaeon]|nr:hypothetical protein [archaeon]
CWSRFKGAERVSDVPYVYDLTVDGNHSFIADNIIVHNTTTAGKLARWFKTRGLSVGLAACDVHRPAAKEQLKQIAQQLEIKVYTEGKKAEDVAKNALKQSKEDILIFDTAGRNALDNELAKELKNLAGLVKADEILLVIPADIGQAAKKQGSEFVKLVGITGIIVTKLDGTAKGGGALSASSVTGAKVKFIGLGEKMDAFEEYDPKRFVSRLIGYGDIQGLLEKAKDVGLDEKKAQKIATGEFTLDDFIEQIGGMQKMGSLSSLAGMIPGLSKAKIPTNLLDVQEGKMKKWVFMIQSMTAEERKNPELIKQARAIRIAKGSGTKPEDVKNLIKNYEKIKKMMKSMGGGKSLKRGQFAQIAKQMGMKV